jgi:hypothetical protein
MTPDDKDIDLEPSEWSSVDKPPPFWGRNAKHFFILLVAGLILHPVIKFIVLTALSLRGR